jgi:plastocyanin
MIRVFKPRRSWIALVLAGVVATLTLAACGSGRPSQADGGSRAQRVEVRIGGFAFEPSRIEVDQGTSVTWTNRDAILHTVTSGSGQKQGVPGVSKDKAASPSGLFHQEVNGEGSTFRFTFEEPGEFNYFCAIHPGMAGVVVVS